MISDFSFESAISTQGATAAPVVKGPGGLALQLPISVPGRLLNLGGVKETVAGVLAHFAPLHLEWYPELDDKRGGMRITAVLEKESGTGGIWALVVLEGAGTGRHRHNIGGPYGECVITLAGELDDVLDDGTAVKLKKGAVMFHAADTVHEASASGYWAGLYHQPCGSTPVA